MIDKTLFFIFAIWYFYKYGPPYFTINFLENLFYFYNNIINHIYLETEDEKEVVKEEPIVKEPSKYENKYLEDIRRLNKEWVLTEEELDKKENLREEFLINSLDTIQNDIIEIHQTIEHFKREIVEDTDSINYIENCNEDGDELIEETTLEERNEYRKSQIDELTDKLNSLKAKVDSQEGLDEVKSDAEEQAHNYIINQKIDKLANCYVMEKTPIGNVIMIYQKDKESFKYYSDCNIPYRYLEVVGRKYVKMFNCRPIFVDMEEELRLFEEKKEKLRAEEKLKDEKEKEKIAEEKTNQESVKVKKNVFAKFKSYNKDAGGKISMAPPPKNSIPKNNTENKENEKVILKERANRYTYEGKFANFNFLQKIERKVFDKKLGLTFADFKKMKK